MQPDAESGGGGPLLQNFYVVDADDSVLDSLATELAGLDVVAAAYVKPEAEPAVIPLPDGMTLFDLAGQNPAAPSATPDFTSNQIYRNAAPDGVDAVYAATQSGGKGAGIKIIDIEGGWQLTHEDLQVNKGGLVGGTQLAGVSWRNHGTAVLGVLGADDNGMGCAGIASDAWIAVISHSIGSANAITTAANMLGPGDVILLEMHRPGPAASFTNNSNQNGYIAVEWWPDDFAAIRYAVSRGIIVIEAAGNGNQNLDDPLYDTPHPSFPPGWTNPFKATNPGSDAVLVGAGAPPPGTHGRTIATARSRMFFSNYGSRVDCQGWGWEVTTAGYGDLQGGPSTPEDRWYTDRFSGTSSASPIVAGVVAAARPGRSRRGSLVCGCAPRGARSRTIPAIRRPSASATCRTCARSSATSDRARRHRAWAPRSRSRRRSRFSGTTTRCWSSSSRGSPRASRPARRSRRPCGAPSATRAR
jgi:hypothetical protein